MILSGQLGNTFTFNDEMTCTKEEFAKAKKEGKLEELYNSLTSTISPRQAVAYYTDDEYHIAVIEDDKGLLHVTSTAALIRLNQPKLDTADLRMLKDIDFTTEVTKPYDLFEMPRSERAMKAMREKREKYENKKEEK